MTLTSDRVPALQSISYRCPQCAQPLPVTEVEIGLDHVIVQAQCAACRLVVAREFELSARVVADFLVERESCHCDVPFDCVHDRAVREVRR